MPPPLFLARPGQLDSEPIRPTSLPPPPRSPSYRFFPSATAPPLPSIPARAVPVRNGLPTPETTPASSVTSSELAARKQASATSLDPHPTPPLPASPTLGSPLSTSDRKITPPTFTLPTLSRKPTRPVHDDLDEIAYMYALRVAILNHRLKARTLLNAALPPLPLPISPTTPMYGLKHSHSASNLSLPGMPSKFAGFQLKHRYSSSSFLPLQAELAEEEGGSVPVQSRVPLIGPVPSPNTLKKRRSRGRGLSLRLLHHHGSEHRVPKTTVREFSQYLLTHTVDSKDLPGSRSPPSVADASWVEVCSAYASREKHCYSARSVEDIAESFTASSPPHHRQHHRARLLSALYTFLPESAYFAQSTTEKDKDLLFRLRADVQRLLDQKQDSDDNSAKHSPSSLSLRPRRSGGLTGGLPRSPTCSSLPASPTAQTRFPRSSSFISTSTASAPSPAFPITPRTPYHTRSHHNLNSPSVPIYPVFARKPTPPPTAVDDDLIKLVGQLWNIPPAQHTQNVKDIESQPLEKLYLDHLKLELSLNNNSTMSFGGDKKKKHHRLSKRVTELVSNFPEIITPGSSSPNGSVKGDYFTPKKKNGAFSRLLKRSSQLSTDGSLHAPSSSGPGPPRISEANEPPVSSGSSITGVAPAPNVNALVTQCENMWEPETIADKEAQANDAFKAWIEVTGQRGEVAAGEALANAIADLVDMLGVEDERPPILETLHNRLLDLLARSVSAIFPTTGVPPPSPPPSVLPILGTQPAFFLDTPRAQDAFQHISANLSAAAVNEFNTVSTELLAHNYKLGAGSKNSPDPVIENFEKLAEWFEQEISNVTHSWKPARCLEELNPAPLIIRAQLPLYLDELAQLELPPGVEGSSEVFISLYEVTYRLLQQYQELVGTESSFDLEGYFEPHIQKWLRETERNQNKDWIFRLVATENWQLVNGRYTQGYLDFMELVSNSVKTITTSSLSPSKRALFLMDLSKSLSNSLVLYASVLNEHLEMETAPPLGDEVSVRSSAYLGGKEKWLQKGKLAKDRLLDQKRRVVAPYVVEESACAKLLDVLAVVNEIPRLSTQMDADGCAAALTNLQIEDGEDTAGRTYTVTIVGASGLFKRNGKPADGFVSIYDRSTGERVLKTETVFAESNPRFGASIRLTLRPNENRLLEVQAHDRALVGQHHTLGSKTLVINEHAHDAVLNLQPNGSVKVRVQKPFQEVNDIASNLSRADSALRRFEDEMRAGLVERILEYPRWLLTPEYLSQVVKSSHLKRELSLDPVFKQLDSNLGVLMELGLSSVVLGLWEGLLSVFMDLLLPALGGEPQAGGGLGLSHLGLSSEKGGPGILSESKTKQVFKWVADTKAFFNPDDQGIPVPLLEGQRYAVLMNVPRWSKAGTRELMDAVSGDIRTFWNASSAPSSRPPTPPAKDAASTPPPLPSRPGSSRAPSLPPRPGSAAPPLPARPGHSAGSSMSTLSQFPAPPSAAPRALNGTADPYSPWAPRATPAPALSAEAQAGLRDRIEAMLRLLSLRQGTRGFVREHTLFLNRDAS